MRLASNNAESLAPYVAHTPDHRNCPGCEWSLKKHMYVEIHPAMKFRDAAEAWLNSRRVAPTDGHAAKVRYISPRTVHDYKEKIKTVNLFFGDHKLKEIHIGHIRTYQADRSAGALPFKHAAGADKINHEINVVQQILRRVGRWDKKIAPFYEPLQLPGFQPPRTMTYQQEEIFFAVARSKPEWHEVYCYALFRNNTGLSGAEARSLRLADVDLAGKFVYVRREHAKNKKQRIRKVPLVFTAEWALQQLVETAREKGSIAPHHYLFPFRLAKCRWDPDRNMTTSGLRKAWSAVRKAAGVPWLRPHDLRHQANTKLYESGADDMTIMSIMGHSSKEMSEHYSSIRDQRKRAVLEEAFERRHPSLLQTSPTKKPPQAARLSSNSGGAEEIS
jgi:integrase